MSTEPVNEEQVLSPSQAEIGLNFSCTLFLLSEIVAVTNELVETLKRKEILTDEEAKPIYEITANFERISLIYKALGLRFAEYYKAAMSNINKDSSDAQPENSATEENPPAPPGGPPNIIVGEDGTEKGPQE
ncbi:MAG: hypothetical protein V3S69_04875 [Dehalococcoidales bacterium]